MNDAGIPVAVDAQHPWLGLDSFTEESRAYFHGREEEVAELARRVQRKLLTILFGQSGLGKTSILRAGIVPKLRPEGHCPVYVRIDYAPESPPPAEQIKQAIFRATEATGTWTKAGTAVQGESLWEFLHHRDDLLKDAAGKTVVPLLIFDQFEEIFTLGQADGAGRRRAAQFIEELADLVENRPPRALEARLEADDTITERFDFARADYRILIALREDYLAHLEGLKGQMPSITQNRMRLARMTGTQALAAVMKPGGRLVSQEVAEAIVRYIAGGSELRNAEVEPSLLSLICRELNNARIAQGRGEISADLLAGSHETILNEFYERALADQPAAVRRFIEDEMLTESGFRESLAEERVVKAFAAAGAPAGALATLVNRRLLRIEERLDVRRVELTHDVLCGVVQASRDLRHEREARDEAERQLAAQRAREEATRKSLARARQIAAGCAVLAIVAIMGAIFGYQNMKRAQEAEARAQATRQAAESARGEAEKLIVYLLDDFYLELEPVGRLDIVGDLSKRALDYYNALPRELVSAETERNRALAQVRYGFVLRYRAEYEEAEKVLADANSVLERLRAAGDRSEIAAVGLALGLSARGRVFDSRGRFVDALPLAEKSVQVIEPLAVAPGASVAVRRTHALASNYLGFVQLRIGNEEAAVKTLEVARAVWRGIDDLRLDNLTAAAGYAESSAWQMEGLELQGQVDRARASGQEAVEVASRVLEKRPGHMPALRSRALATNFLARIEVFALRPGKALALTERSIRDWENLLALDPGNTIAWNNLGSSLGWKAWALNALGRPSQAVAVTRASLEFERRGGSASIVSNIVSFHAGWRAVWESELGNRAAAEVALEERRRYLERFLAPLTKDAFPRLVQPELTARFEAAMHFAAGEAGATRDVARASIGRHQQIKAANEGQSRAINEGLAIAHEQLTAALYLLRDYPAAEAAAREAIRYRELLKGRTRWDELDRASAQANLAMVLARRERLAQAREAVEPALALHRKLHAAGSEDLNQHLEFARALYAAALATPLQAPSLLQEGARILDAFPPEAARRKSVALVRNWIAEEQGRPR
jgi:tetratricopeptide (TPR) repeat protein